MTYNYPPSLLEVLEIIDTISDRNERKDILIYWSDKYKRADESITGFKPFSDKFKVPACESEAYVWATEKTDGTETLKFHYVVENPQGLSAKALSAILAKTISGADLQQVHALESVEIIQKLFGSKMGMMRTQGLRGIIKMSRAYATQAISKKKGNPDLL